MLWGVVSIILGVWIVGAPIISSDVWIMIAAICALASGAGTVMWVAAIATQPRSHERFSRWIAIGGAIVIAVAAAGAWTFGRLRLASAAPIGIELSASAQRGQQVFLLHCAACHNASTHMKYGPGLAGLFDPGGPLLPRDVSYNGKLPNGKDITSANVEYWLRTGGKGQIGVMPPAALVMRDDEVADVIAFLKALKK
jgi:cytochrome c